MEIPYNVELKPKWGEDSIWVPGNQINLAATPREPRQLEADQGNHRTAILRHENTLWMITHWGSLPAPVALTKYEGAFVPATWFHRGRITQGKTGVLQIHLGVTGMKSLEENFGDLRAEAEWLGRLLRPRIVPGTLVEEPKYSLLYTRLA